MAKTEQFKSVISKYSSEELKVLVAEANFEMKARVKEEKKIAKLAEAQKMKEAKRAEAGKLKEIKNAEAVKLRDKLKIGSTATYTSRSGKASGIVIMIGKDKIQVEVNGVKTTVNILKLV